MPLLLLASSPAVKGVSISCDETLNAGKDLLYQLFSSSTTKSSWLVHSAYLSELLQKVVGSGIRIELKI